MIICVHIVSMFLKKSPENLGFFSFRIWRRLCPKATTEAMTMSHEDAAHGLRAMAYAANLTSEQREAIRYALSAIDTSLHHLRSGAFKPSRL